MSIFTTIKEILVAEVQEQSDNLSKVLTESILNQCDPSMLKRIRRNLNDIYEEIHS